MHDGPGGVDARVLGETRAMRIVLTDRAIRDRIVLTYTAVAAAVVSTTTVVSAVGVLRALGNQLRFGSRLWRRRGLITLANTFVGTPIFTDAPGGRGVQTDSLVTTFVDRGVPLAVVTDLLVFLRANCVVGAERTIPLVVVVALVVPTTIVVRAWVSVATIGILRTAGVQHAVGAAGN